MEKIRSDREMIFSGNFTNHIASPYHSVMAIPINHADDTNGLAIILHEDKYYFTFETFKLMQALIQHTSLAITNTLLKRAVRTNDYYRLSNWLYTQEIIWRQALRNPLHTDDRGVLILFDIDDFKQVNDSYGHHTGDKVIIQVADTIRQHVDIDVGHVPARWGGEELAIYLPNAKLEERIEIATRIRERVMVTSKPK